MAAPPEVPNDPGPPRGAPSGERARLMRSAALAGLVFACIAMAFLDRVGKLMTFPLFAVVCLVSCIGLYRHYRVIRDTPTSRIASAAPGYVELAGHAALLPGAPLVSPGGQPCCWYSVQEFTRISATTKWWRRSRRASTEPFLLVDDTGVCAILPEGAGHFLTAHEKRGGGDDYGYHEWVLLPGDVVYAAGELITADKVAPELAVRLTREHVKALIAERHRERDQILSGERAAAGHAAVPHREGGDPVVAAIPVLRKPRGGRLYWIANEMPDTLGANVRFGAALFFFAFLYFTAMLVWLVV